MAQINQQRRKDGLLTSTSSLLSISERVWGSSERNYRWLGRPFLFSEITNSMVCHHCGENNSDGAQFCKSCGLNVSPELKSRQEKSSQPIFSRLGGTVLGLIGIVVIYGVVNGVMWFGQEVYHHEDNVKLEQIQARINQIKVKLESFESSMQLNGASEVAYKNYEKMLAEHNKLIEEYNALAKESGTRWYVVPVPAGHSKPVTH